MLESYTDEQIQRWLYIRAIEWTAWPSFVTQPVVPILFVFVRWYWVLLGLFALEILWCAIRYSFVSPRVAGLAVPFALFKWPAALGSSIYLFIQHDYLAALIALLWPIVGGFVGIPGKICVVELAMAKKIGYVDASV